MGNARVVLQLLENLFVCSIEQVLHDARELNDVDLVTLIVDP